MPGISSSNKMRQGTLLENFRILQHKYLILSIGINQVHRKSAGELEKLHPHLKKNSKGIKKFSACLPKPVK